jgi:hypothetical protein
MDSLENASIAALAVNFSSNVPTGMMPPAVVVFTRTDPTSAVLFPSLPKISPTVI